MDIDPRRSLSRLQFCWVENISPAKYHELQKKGLGPAVTDVDGVQRITPEARAEWHQLMAERAKSGAVRLEAARRRELAIIAGRAAAASPNHVSKNRARLVQRRRRR
jgi:truncated hemoglobin YjbI